MSVRPSKRPLIVAEMIDMDEGEPTSDPAGRRGAPDPATRAPRRPGPWASAPVALRVAVVVHWLDVAVVVHWLDVALAIAFAADFMMNGVGFLGSHESRRSAGPDDWRFLVGGVQVLYGLGAATVAVAAAICALGLLWRLRACWALSLAWMILTLAAASISTVGPLAYALLVPQFVVLLWPTTLRPLFARDVG